MTSSNQEYHNIEAVDQINIQNNKEKSNMLNNKYNNPNSNNTEIIVDSDDNMNYNPSQQIQCPTLEDEQVKNFIEIIIADLDRIYPNQSDSKMKTSYIQNLIDQCEEFQNNTQLYSEILSKTNISTFEGLLEIQKYSPDLITQIIQQYNLKVKEVNNKLKLIQKIIKKKKSFDCKEELNLMMDLEKLQKQYNCYPELFESQFKKRLPNLSHHVNNLKLKKTKKNSNNNLGNHIQGRILQNNILQKQINNIEKIFNILKYKNKQLGEKLNQVKEQQRGRLDDQQSTSPNHENKPSKNTDLNVEKQRNLNAMVPDSGIMEDFYCENVNEQENDDQTNQRIQQINTQRKFGDYDDVINDQSYDYSELQYNFMIRQKKKVIKIQTKYNAKIKQQIDKQIQSISNLKESLQNFQQESESIMNKLGEQIEKVIYDYDNSSYQYLKNNNIANNDHQIL